ncbi:hypothetical protein DFQ29_002121, partial [Apophysomyces sp. BC1021]
MNLNNFSREQLTEMLALFKELKSQQRDRRSEMQELPSEIFSDMEDVATKSLKANLQKLAKEAIAYDGGRWTQSGAINKSFSMLDTKTQTDLERLEERLQSSTRTLNSSLNGKEAKVMLSSWSKSWKTPVDSLSMVSRVENISIKKPKILLSKASTFQDESKQKTTRKKTKIWSSLPRWSITHSDKDTMIRCSERLSSRDEMDLDEMRDGEADNPSRRGRRNFQFGRKKTFSGQ